MPHHHPKAHDAVMTTSLKAVLFDVGGVLVESPFKRMAPIAAAHGIDMKTFAQIAVGRGAYDDGTHPWHRIERGEITVEQFNSATAEMATGMGVHNFPPLPDASILMRPEFVRPNMVALVRECRAQGLHTGIVTNNIAEWTVWRELFPLAHLFDDVIDSWEVGMRKPEARIYELAAQRLGVTPGECLFLDDMLENLVGAQAVGMQTILVDESDSAIAEVTARIDRPAR
jgi:epoxide hydrolase-like predicted phosphatase